MYEESIKDFLSRPILCTTTATPWTSTVVPGTILMQMDVPSHLLSNPLYAEKIKGFYSFKGDLVLKLQTNAQRFQCGMLLMCVLPGGSFLSPARVKTATSDLTFMTQLPSVRHNIATTNESVLKVPFNSPLLAYNLDSTKGGVYATVYYVVYGQLSADTVNYKCWCHFENVELSYPLAQSGSSMKVAKKANKYTPADQEDSSVNVSKPIATIASGIRSLGDNVPLISSFSQPTAWFLDSLSRGFKSFGLSNAVDTSIRHSFVPRITSHQNNVDVNDTVDSFGYNASNKVAHLPGFAGTDVDEMSIQHICSIPSYYATFELSTLNAPDTYLWNTYCAIKPRIADIITPGPTARPCYFPAPFHFIASRFKFWRGSIKFKFYAIKCGFHNGRVLFTFNPSIVAASPVNSQYSSRYIWDISQTDTYEITCPFVSTMPWLNTEFTTADTSNTFGNIWATVFTPLEAAGDAPTTVKILVEISAGPDMSFAVQSPTSLQAILIESTDSSEYFINYRKFKNLPTRDSSKIQDVHPGSQKMNKTNKNKVQFLKFNAQTKSRQKTIVANRDFKRQSIMTESPVELSMGGYDDSTAGSINQLDLDTAGENSLYTTGEEIKSLRQVLKRSNIVYLGDHTGTGVTSTFVSSTHVPYFPSLSLANLKVPSSRRYFQEDYTYYSALFWLQRGGVIYRAIPLASTAARLRAVYQLDQLISPPIVTNTGFTPLGQSVTQVVSNQSIQGAIDVHVPFYSPTHSKPINHLPWSNSGSFDATWFGFAQGMIHINSINATTNVNNFDVYKQVADDFSFGGFIGTVPLLITWLPSTNVPIN